MFFFNSLPVPESSKVIPAHPWLKYGGVSHVLITKFQSSDFDAGGNEMYTGVSHIIISPNDQTPFNESDSFPLFNWKIGAKATISTIRSKLVWYCNLFANFMNDVIMWMKDIAHVLCRPPLWKWKQTQPTSLHQPSILGLQSWLLTFRITNKHDKLVKLICNSCHLSPIDYQTDVRYKQVLP